MAELEDLGTPPVFAEIVRVGYAVARLRLPTDTTVPREVAAAASRVDDAVIALQNAVDLAVELQAEGARQPVSLVSTSQARPDEDRGLVWFQHAALQANLLEFVGTSVGFPPPQGRATAYDAVMMQAAQALHAIEEQRLLAQGSRWPRRPEPPDLTPSPSSGRPSVDRDADDHPRSDTPVPPVDRDRPPAAVVSSASGRPEGTRRDPGTRQAPTLGELERRISTVSRNESEPDVGLARPPTDRARIEAREL